MINALFGNKKTYKQHKKTTDSSPSTFALKEFAEQTLGSGNSFKELVKLPEGETLDEWLAVHLVGKFLLISNSCRFLSTSKYAIRLESRSNLYLQVRLLNTALPRHVQ
jgi:hypothetical protein